MCNISIINVIIIIIYVTVLIGLYVLWGPITRFALLENVILKNNSEPMLRFSEGYGAIYKMHFYFFNVTNPLEVKKDGAKPLLSEVGPIVMDQFGEKEFIKNDQEAGLITFKLRRKWLYNEAESKAPLNVIITLPNIPILSLFETIGDMPLVRSASTITRLGDLAISNLFMDSDETEFLTMSAEKFLYRGSFRRTLAKLNESLTNLYLSSFLPKPWPLKDNMFAFFYKRNNTWSKRFDGVMTVSTGKGTKTRLDNVGQVVQWNRENRQKNWLDRPSFCNALNVSLGEIYPPFLEERKVQRLELLAHDLCLKLQLINTGQHEETQGIKAMKFVLDNGTFASPANNPENVCYCQDVVTPICIWDGVIELEKCQSKGVFASNQHFYGSADPNEFLRHVDGIRGPEPQDQTYILVESNTGSTVYANVKLQLNVRMRKAIGTSLFDFVKEPHIMPVLKIQQLAYANPSMAFKVSLMLPFLNYWFTAAIIVVVAIVNLVIVNHLTRGGHHANRDPERKSGPRTERKSPKSPKSPKSQKSTKSHKTKSGKTKSGSKKKETN